MIVGVAAVVLAPLFVAAAVATLVGDATVGATVAGLFSVVNTALNAWLLQKTVRVDRSIGRTHELLRAPRQAVYDAEGRVIGTVLALKTRDDELQHRRRLTDPPPEVDG